MYLDYPLWVKLAKHNGHQLVPKHMDCSPASIEMICRKIGIPVALFMQWAGIRLHVPEYDKLSQFQERNPRLPLYALQGQLLELLYEHDINKGLFND